MILPAVICITELKKNYAILKIDQKNHNALSVVLYLYDKMLTSCIFENCSFLSSASFTVDVESIDELVPEYPR